MGYLPDAAYWKSGLDEAAALLDGVLADLNDRSAGTADSNELRFTPSELVIRLAHRFKSIARQLRFRHDDRSTLEVNDEHDAQDLFHALLRGFFDDVRREEFTPSYAGGNSRVDFLLKKEQILVELKKTRSSMKPKRLGEELIVDIARYRDHPDCKRLICFVYDPEALIPNPKGLECDLSGDHDGLSVTVVIAPKD